MFVYFVRLVNEGLKLSISECLSILYVKWMRDWNYQFLNVCLFCTLSEWGIEIINFWMFVYFVRLVNEGLKLSISECLSILYVEWMRDWNYQFLNVCLFCTLSEWGIETINFWMFVYFVRWVNEGLKLSISECLSILYVEWMRDWNYQFLNVCLFCTLSEWGIETINFWMFVYFVRWVNEGLKLSISECLSILYVEWMRDWNYQFLNVCLFCTLGEWGIEIINFWMFVYFVCSQVRCPLWFPLSFTGADSWMPWTVTSSKFPTNGRVWAVIQISKQVYALCTCKQQ